MAKYKNVKGLAELDRALAELQKLTGKSGKPTLRRALVKSIKSTEQEARALSPWPDTADESNIKAASSYRDGNGNRKKGREPKTAVYAYVYDPKPLAAIFEWGTKDRYQTSTDPNRYTGVIEPHHYMRSAVENTFDEVVENQASIVGEEIEKTWNRHVKKTGG